MNLTLTEQGYDMAARNTYVIEVGPLGKFHSRFEGTHAEMVEHVVGVDTDVMEIFWEKEDESKWLVYHRFHA